MNIPDIIFIIFSLVALLSALGMVFTRNIFRAAFLLLICLVAVAGIYVLLSATYLAAIQLLIYAGGVVVLLSFGIMLTQRSKEGKFLTQHHLVVPAFIVFGGLIHLFFKLFNGLSYTSTNEAQSDQVAKIGVSFVTEYILSFELVAFLLLVVLVGAALYAKKSSES